MSIQPESQQMSLTNIDAAHVAFDVLYQQYAPHLTAYFYRHTGHRQDAEDLTATTFSKALSSIECYTEQGRFEAWLWSIARHTLRDLQRRRHDTVNIDLIGFGLIDPAPATENQVLQTEQAELLEGLLHALPADQREALILRFVRESSFNEIAGILGRSIGAAKMLVQRALKTLRMQYPQHELAKFESTSKAHRSVQPRTTSVSFGMQQTIAAGVWLMARLRQLQPAPVLQPVLIPVRSPDPIVLKRRR